MRIDCETRDIWLAQRGLCLTATDIAAIVGVDPWRGPMDVYAAKKDLLGVEPPSLPMRIGLALEKLIGELYAERTDNQVMANEYALWKSSENSRLAATPDFWIVGQNALMESKVYGSQAAWGEDGTDDVPMHITIQCHAQMAATGAERVDVAVLLQRTDFRVYSIKRDEAMVAAIERIAERFWTDHVEKSIPPETGFSSNEAIVAVYPMARQPLIPASAEQGFVIASLAEVRAEVSALEERKEALEKQLKGYIGESEGLEWEKWRVSWKNQMRKTVDWKRLTEELAVPKALIEKFTEKKEIRVLRWGNA